MAAATTKTDNEIPGEVMAGLQEAAKRAVSGARDPQIMRQACERMDTMREEIRQKSGELDVAVDLIRESREEE